MKNRMATSFAALAAVILTGLSAQAGSDTHGGGGIKRNGQFLTFGSAGVFPVQQYDPSEEIEVITQVFKSLNMPSVALGNFLKDALSSPSRKYFVVSKLSQDEEVRLLSFYKEKFLNLSPGDELVVFAHTDRETRETYLLPTFLEIAKEPTPVSRAAILLHEIAWLVDNDLYDITRGNSWATEPDLVKVKSSAYNKVVDLEIAFESVARCVGGCSKEKARLIGLLTSQLNEIQWPSISVLTSLAGLDQSNGINMADLDLSIFVDPVATNENLLRCRGGWRDQITSDLMGRMASVVCPDGGDWSTRLLPEATIAGAFVQMPGYGNSYFGQFLATGQSVLDSVNITCAGSGMTWVKCNRIARMALSNIHLLKVNMLDRRYGSALSVQVREESREGKKLSKVLKNAGFIMTLR